MKSLSQYEYLDSESMAQPSDSMIQTSEPFNPERPGALPLGIVGGLAAAILGGVIWSLVLIFLEYELGMLAWGIGLACGFAVVTLSGNRGIPMQIIAVATSIIGILIGKYGVFYYFLKEGVTEEYGIEAAMDVTLYSMDVMIYFAEELGSMLGGYDLLWIALAVGTAWKVAGPGTAEAEARKPTEL